MKPALFLIAIAAFSACTENGSNVSVSETDLHGSCEALVSAETGVRPEDVTSISTTTEPSGSVTTVSVVGAQAPWLCRADPYGVISGVEYSQEG